MALFSFFRKKDSESQLPETRKDGENIGETEQRTPKAGYILLIAMIITAVYFGWRALDDLQNVPTRPETLSVCSAPFVQYEWEDYGRYRYDIYPAVERIYEPPASKGEIPPDQCIFSPLEAKYGIPQFFEQRKSKDLALRNAELELQKTINEIQDYERQYGLGLQEGLTPEQRRLYPVNEIRQKLQVLYQKRTDLEKQINTLKADLKPMDDQMKAKYRELMPEYRTAWRWFEFKVFLLEAIFVFPFFFWTFWMYRKLYARKSPFTIIFTALLAVASIFVIRITLVWFWNLFLARVIETIWNFAQSFALLKSIVLYGGMLISIAIFGGAVYFLQRYIFNPSRVALRNLRNNKCPQCESTLHIADAFCPSCGKQLKEKCPVCSKDRFIDFPTCPHCGSVR